MSTRRVPTACPPCGLPGTLHGPAVALKFAPKRPTPLSTGVALNEVAWKDDKGEEVDCTICAYPMSADSGANPWTGRRQRCCATAKNLKASRRRGTPSRAPRSASA